MKRIFLFDIDGTLTPPRLPASSEFVEFFVNWGRENQFYLATGSDFEKVREQLPQEILDMSSGIFCCMGNELLKDGGKRLIYRNGFEPNVELIRTLQSYLETSDFPHPWREPPFIEHRVGMINFSIVGRGVKPDMREIYNNFDRKTLERERMRDVIINKFPDLGASIGGKISIDIYPRGKDKSQCVQWIMENEKPNYIIFFGDRVFKGGNDFAVSEELERIRKGVWFNVRGWQETKALLGLNHLYINRDVDFKE